MQERRNVRVSTGVRFEASQDDHRETCVTLNLSVGGLSFSSRHHWAPEEPICFDFDEEGDPFSLFGRIVRREGVVHGVQFYPDRRAEQRISDLLLEQVEAAGFSTHVLAACAACAPGQKPVVFVAPRTERKAKALTSATVGDVGLDGASLRCESRPPVGSHVVVSLRSALGRPVTVTGEVVRATPEGFAILYADASHSSRKYVDTVRGRLSPRDPTPYYSQPLGRR